jgi:hypothetical protein
MYRTTSREVAGIGGNFAQPDRVLAADRVIAVNVSHMERFTAGQMAAAKPSDHPA